MTTNKEILTDTDRLEYLRFRLNFLARLSSSAMAVHVRELGSAESMEEFRALLDARLGIDGNSDDNQ